MFNELGDYGCVNVALTNTHVVIRESTYDDGSKEVKEYIKNTEQQVPNEVFKIIPNWVEVYEGIDTKRKYKIQQPKLKETGGNVKVEESSPRALLYAKYSSKEYRGKKPEVREVQELGAIHIASVEGADYYLYLNEDEFREIIIEVWDGIRRQSKVLELNHVNSIIEHIHAKSKR